MLFDHVGFAAGHDLQFPCEAEYADYVSEHLTIGAHVVLLEGFGEHGVTPDEIGITRSACITGTREDNIGSFLFRSGMHDELEVLLPLYKVKVLSDARASAEEPSQLHALDHRSVTLALAHVYYYRLNTESLRSWPCTLPLAV